MNIVETYTQKMSRLNTILAIDWNAMVEFNINSTRECHRFDAINGPEIYYEWLHDGEMVFCKEDDIDKLLKTDKKTIEFDIWQGTEKIHVKLINFHVTGVRYTRSSTGMLMGNPIVNFTCSNYKAKVVNIIDG